ncbi:MAG: hypothetical protein ABSB96_03530 [Gaiellaceae bacterium]
MAQAIEKASGSGFRRQVVFRIGEDDWPYLETAAREHGGIQAGIIAALRAHAAQRLAPPAEPSPVPELLGATEPTLESGRPVSSKRRAESARSEEDGGATLASRSASRDMVELNVAEAAALLGLRPESLRSAIKRGARPGRRSETGFYLVKIERETLRRVNPPLTLRGAAEVLGRRPETLRRHCRDGHYPNARHDDTGWRIPAKDLL